MALWSEMKVAVANNTSIIRVYNLETGNCRFLRGHTDIVLTLSVQKDKLVSGSKVIRGFQFCIRLYWF